MEPAVETSLPEAEPENITEENVSVAPAEPGQASWKKEATHRQSTLS
jgi:hypothetical protein